MPNTLAELTRELIAFRDARDWRQFHSLKNLMVGLSLEAAELLELAHWQDEAALEGSLEDGEFRQRLAEESADVLIYLLLICERAGIDLGEATARKIRLNAAKYPADKARGNNLKYTKF